jgi:hypothetical protein
MDCIVVYKVDRLSRSLIDFAGIMTCWSVPASGDLRARCGCVRP